MRYLANVTTLELNQDLCTGCGMCAVVCPHAVFSMDNGKAQIDDQDACMECGACSLNCPETAIFVQAGVGCAQAVINSALGRTGASCCSLEDYSSNRTEGGTMNTGTPLDKARDRRRRPSTSSPRLSSGQAGQAGGAENCGDTSKSTGRTSSGCC